MCGVEDVNLSVVKSLSISSYAPRSKFKCREKDSKFRSLNHRIIAFDFVLSRSSSMVVESIRIMSPSIV